ncbi:MAG: FdrA family protein [Actinomycetota bacterium]|nr:FdrA family protein [Actinomycetota bacterium]
MSVQHVEARAGAYADSVTLMQLSRQAGSMQGVESALVAMGTALNLDLLEGMGFARPHGAGTNDLILAIRTDHEDALRAALAALSEALTARPSLTPGSHGEQVARTISSAARSAGRSLALISVPGEHAFTEAMDALDSGCDVMIFSDNVRVDHEIVLKDVAAQRGLLVLGPDCGTSVVGGIGLGFSHTLAPGRVGVVAASGTGAQQVLCLLDAAGVGVSAALGVGGRDLSAAVAGRSARAALTALDEDTATELIILISKPPAAEVARELRAFASGLSTPVGFAFVGSGFPDLSEATEQALRLLGIAAPAWAAWQGRQAAPRAGSLRGLFAGGTLCDEAMVLAADRLGRISSNIPLQPDWRVDPRTSSPGHVMIDFGDDELTRGRPHPMIDQSLRLDRIRLEASDPATAVIMLDAVLGHGAHPDPAAELAPAIASIDPDIAVIVSLIGAAADPQDLGAQARALQAAGAHVFASNAHAARYACTLISRRA